MISVDVSWPSGRRKDTCPTLQSQCQSKSAWLTCSDLGLRLASNCKPIEWEILLTFPRTELETSFVCNTADSGRLATQYTRSTGYIFGCETTARIDPMLWRWLKALRYPPTSRLPHLISKNWSQGYPPVSPCTLRQFHPNTDSFLYLVSYLYVDSFLYSASCLHNMD